MQQVQKLFRGDVFCGPQVVLYRTYIGSVERGERNIALLNILTLATVLDVDAGTLLTGLQRQPR